MVCNVDLNKYFFKSKKRNRSGIARATLTSLKSENPVNDDEIERSLIRKVTYKYLYCNSDSFQCSSVPVSVEQLYTGT